MKKYSILCLCTVILMGCGNSERQRQRFYENCMQTFIEIYPSMAEQLRMGGVPSYAIAEMAMYTPGLYERPSNEELVECACSRLSARKKLPRRNQVILEQEYEKEANECKKMWKTKK